MASPLTQAGAASEPSNFAALHMNRMITGLWTNRSPLRDAATSYLQEKYYSASRQDSMLAGLNTELCSRLTLIRRPGNSVYNSQTFPPITRFYDFRIFSTTAEIIRVMADTAGVVYDATGPNTQTNIWNKSAGAGATYFQSVGNNMYMGNGVDQVQWIQSALQWTAKAALTAGQFLVDSNGNIQMVSAAITANVTSTTFTGNSVAIVFRGPNPFPTGTVVTPAGLTAAAFLNGVALTVSSNTAVPAGILANYTHLAIAATADTGTVTSAAPTVTGAAVPAWNVAINGATSDGGILWINKGSAVQGWGLLGPANAPTVVQTPLPASYPQWSASTVYSSSLLIVDSNGNIQQLTAGGVTGGSQPAWAGTAGQITNDGTARWTNQGTALWIAGKAYAAGALISVTYTYYVSVNTPSSQGEAYEYNGGNYSQYTNQQRQVPVTVTAFFQATTAGVSGSYQPAWVDGYGLTVGDGTVTWTNTGGQSTWAATVGAGTAVSLAQTVVDSNGRLQTITTSGKSGTAAPTWATTTGATTPDNLATWTAGAAYAVAQTASQAYTYVFGNSVTGDKSNASPLSAAVTLAANSAVQVQGFRSNDPQVDTIFIFRTAKGGPTQLLLDQIPNPTLAYTWTYTDTSSDDALTVEIQAATADQLTPPPAGAIAPSYHLQRIFVAVQNVLSWSAGPDAYLFAANGNSGFPGGNAFTYPSKIVRTWPCALGLLVFTTSDIYQVLGSGTADDPLYTLPFLEGTGLLSYDAFTVQGSTAYILTNAMQLMALTPDAGVIEVGFPIADRIEASYGTASHLTFHAQSSEDTALYAGDGLLGWYRMAPTSAPESGFTWSPQAMVTGGCTALRSVEVSPGQKRLLIGPQVSGPILMRDRSTNLDNGSPYVAWTTLGSIVLAQPGQVAGIRFFTLESTRVGTRASLSVLLGEISGTFETLRRTRQDPPLLPASATVYADRFDIAQNGQPTYCRHFQMTISWPAENVANELLTFTIFGELMNEAKSQ